MKYKDALKILEIGEFTDEDLEIEYIKKKYKAMALMYHPDRNNAENATEKFQEIQAAYECLVDYYEDTVDSDDDDDPITEFENLDKNSYRGMLYSFLKNILKEDVNGKNVLHTIIQKISSTCEENSIEILRKLDKNTLIKIYELLKKYSKVLHFGDEFIEKVSLMISEKMKNDGPPPSCGNIPFKLSYQIQDPLSDLQIVAQPPREF